MTDAEKAAAEAKAAEDAAAKTAAEAAAAAAAGAGSAGDTEPQDVASLPAWAQKVIADTRSEAATHRTKATTAAETHQATMDKLATALGLKPDDDPAAAAKTAGEERDAAQAVSKNLAAENAVLRMASKNGANPESLTDSRSFMKMLEAIDPVADDFAAQVDAAIKAALEANPALKTGPPTPARSGGPVGGGAPAGEQSDDPQQRSRDYYERQASK